MNHWYLVASLPLVALGAEPPLSVDGFRALCGEHLPDRDLRELDAVLGDAGTSQFARAWRETQRRIEDECAVLRAARLGLDASPWRKDIGVPDATLIAAVREAFQQPDPRSRELQLDALRWRTLEDLARSAPFGLPAVMAYGLRLRLAARWSARTEAAGRQQLGRHLDAMFAVFDRKAQEDQP
ncbi:MAG TPA: DUF2764 family protein [Planctomycetota bacterium]|nr:DUF2764 family protein [Planctomycetota bacterium]